MSFGIEMCIVAGCLEVGATEILLTYLDDTLLVVIVEDGDVAATASLRPSS